MVWVEDINFSPTIGINIDAGASFSIFYEYRAYGEFSFSSITRSRCNIYYQNLKKFSWFWGQKNLSQPAFFINYYILPGICDCTTRHKKVVM
jgi:hypothetical protein